MKDYKIIFDEETCMGTLLCTEIYKKFIKGNSEKPILKGSKENILEISKDELEKALKAAKTCPTNAINIVDLKNNKQII